MMNTADLILLFGVVVQAVLVTAYLGRQIDRKLDFSMYDRKHEDLERRISIRLDEIERRLREIEQTIAAMSHQIRRT